MTEIPVRSNGNNDWIKYRLLVLSKIDSIETDVSSLADEQIKIRLDIRELRVRAAVWGGITGGVLSLIGLALNVLFS